MKKIIVKGNAATTYIEHRHINIGTSVLIRPQNVNFNIFLILFLNSIIKTFLWTFCRNMKSIFQVSLF